MMDIENKELVKLWEHEIEVEKIIKQAKHMPDILNQAKRLYEKIQLIKEYNHEIAIKNIFNSKYRLSLKC